MSVVVTAWRDEGALVNGRGATTRQVANWNMKDHPSYSAAYYPTDKFASGPLIRPLTPGVQTFSYTVYTYFKLEGAYNIMKNPKLIISVENEAQSSDIQLFYKLTNVYREPTNQLDGDMMLLADNVADKTVIISPILFPTLNSVGPHIAASHAPSFAGISPLYTNYFVTQMRVNRNSLVGNTAEFKLRFEIKEYGVF